VFELCLRLHVIKINFQAFNPRYLVIKVQKLQQ
jgi:hypothetical protein